MSRRSIRSLALVLPFLAPDLFGAGETLTPDLHHLRNAEPREWNHFPGQAEAPELKLSFDLEDPERFRLLTLRQADVKQTWSVTINDRKIGRLEREQNDMEHSLAIPPGLLTASRNALVVSTESTAPDDIRVGELVLHESPLEELTRAAGIRVSVKDADTGDPLPSRLTIADAARGTMPFIGASSDDRLAVRAGAVYTLDGRAEFGVREGRYRVWAGRGFEYSLARAEVRAVAGETAEIEFELRREVPTPGLVACDTHLHTFEFARHGDATLIERLITLAGEGIELPVSTEHNQHIDYAPEARRIGADRFFTPVVGCEVTTSEGHFNSFPVESGATPAETKLRPWPLVFKGIYDTPGVAVVILNHPRDVHRGFRPFDPARFDPVAGVFTDGRKLEANGVELINSGAQQSDPMQIVRDWFALLRSGHRIAGVGCSDSHTVNFAIAGQARTYVPCPDDDPADIDVAAAVGGFVAGRTHVSFGLLTRLELSGDGKAVTARVLGPGWTNAARLTLFRDGRPVRVEDIPSEKGAAAGLKFETAWSLADLEVDAGTFLVAIAEGPGIDGPWWPMMAPYQALTPEYKPYVMGISPALWPKGRKETGRR